MGVRVCGGWRVEGGRRGRGGGGRRRRGERGEAYDSMTLTGILAWDCWEQEVVKS